ncbi:RICIN domain-containing protein [Phytohabitans sp. LJ34]|uniref:RICIN domain-containing protein n=1 Tax=Phytohabitans sp. LJ34 TaxID=3452217 RepID=UPI003F8BD3B2
MPNLRPAVAVVTAAATALAGFLLAVAVADPASAAVGAVRGVPSGRCVDVPSASKTNGTQVKLYDCNGGSNQQWNYNSGRQLAAYAGTKCLDAYNNGTTAGTQVVIWDCTGGTNQQWSVNSNGTITSALSGLCLDANGGGTGNGTAIILWTCNGGANQRWNSTAGGAGCPGSGGITYTLHRASSPTADQTDSYNRITEAMNLALTVYNCYLSVRKSLSIYYEPSVPTADGNYNGTIRFGAKSTMVQATAMHEIAHTLGVGTYGGWASRVSGGRWTGTNAINQLRTLDGNSSAVLYADGAHFWPHGLNQASEATSADEYVRNVKMVAALRQDMGL